MALTTLELTTINRGIAINKQLLALAEELQELNDIYESGGGVKSTITQANLDLATQLSGLTKTQLDDGMFAAEATVRGAIETARVQLTTLASRG